MQVQRTVLGAVIITDHCKSLTEAKWTSLVAARATNSDADYLALPAFELTGSDGIFNRDHTMHSGSMIHSSATTLQNCAPMKSGCRHPTRPVPAPCIRNIIVVQIDIIKNGARWQTLVPLSPTYEGVLEDEDVTGDGYYRVEVTSMDPISGKIEFAWSNPVFVPVP